MRKRLLLVSLAEHFGGTEVYVEALSRLLQDNFEVHVVGSNQELIRRLKQSGARFSTIAPASGLWKLAQLLKATLLILRLATVGRLDVIHINGYAEIVLLLLARVLGKGAVATRHLSFTIAAKRWRDAPERFLARALYKWLAPTANLIICVSEAVAKEVVEFVPASRVVVIPNWVEDPRPASVNDKGPADPVSLLYVGRLTRSKGLQVLISALHILSHSITACPPFHLTIVGSGPDRDSLRKLAADLPVTFSGAQQDVAAFYDRADIFINPSLGPEGMPLVTLEAMSHSLPCVLSDLPVHYEISGDHGAILYPRDDPKQLALEIKHLIEDKTARLSFAAAAAQIVASRHSAEQARVAYISALKKVA